MEKETKEKIKTWVMGTGLAVFGGLCLWEYLDLSDLKKQVKEEKEKSERAKKENRTLREENSELKGENKTLERENRRLGKENGNLTYQIGKKEAEKRGLYNK